MRFEIDFSQLKEFIDKLPLVQEVADETTWEILLDAATKLDERIDTDMPVDTGRAVAGWGKYKPELLRPVAVPTDASRTKFITRPSRFTQLSQVSSAEDAIWEENKQGLWIVEGTTVPYVPLLNEGSVQSQQAPAGFIDRAVEWIETEIPKSAMKLIQAMRKALGD